MVNSSSIGCEENGNRKVSCIQTNSFHSETQSSSPITATSATQSRTDFPRTADSNTLCKTDAVEPTPSKTDLDSSMTISYNSVLLSGGLVDKSKKSFFCSVPLEKVQTILSTYTPLRCERDGVKISRKILCLYCDRTFVNVNLKQKHIERCHSAKQLRRVSLRKHQNCFTSTPCIYCDKFSSTTHTLKELLEHLVLNHSNKYFGCLSCEDRYFDLSQLSDHNALYHNLESLNREPSSIVDSNQETTRSRQKTKHEESKLIVVNSRKCSGRLRSDVSETKKPANVKNLRNKKFSVKSSRIIIKRSKRLQAKLNVSQQKKQGKDLEKKDKYSKYEQSFSTKLNEKSSKASSNSTNPYPEFDTFFQVKKITDHSIDNLKISSLTFDDVFDKAFFNRIKCNIQENLLHHIDGKLFKNEESESRISNFEKTNSSHEVQNLNAENYGCELSLNAIAPTTMLLSSQFGEDPESQIEYGSKPSKKKAQIKKDEVHYKYLTRRKYQASILERKENRDLSKLDMWTQYVIKNRQQKVLDDKKSPKEILDYFSGEEYKNVMKREELNRILDRRGPFEDLREEVSKQAALNKLNGETENYINDDSLVEVGELLNDILNNVFELSTENGSSVANYPKGATHLEEDVPEIPSYLNLRRTSSLPSDNEIDKSDKIALICSSQETENFELPSNTVRGKNEKVELTGEWARSRIYVCAACGLKLQNIKQFLEHKSTSHQYVWVQHYEFVGNQSELYRHLSIPVLGKVGVLEQHVQCKLWRRSDARLCTKCGKQCNSLGELHRHILECGGDWTWMLVRKKYKYRPFGAKSRRKRRGLVKRIYTQKTEPSEKKIYKKSFDIPRQKASDADTIQRMLANLPPKRTSRKIICLKDGFSTNRKKQVKTTKQSKFKCGKLIRGKNKEQNKNTSKRYKRVQKNQPNSYRRSLRCLNKVITGRILDTDASLIVRKRYKKQINKQETENVGGQVTKRRSKHLEQKATEEQSPTLLKNLDATCTNNEDKVEDQSKTTKRSSPRIEKLLQFKCVRKTVADNMNVKRFFPVKKKGKVELDKQLAEIKDNVKRKTAQTILNKKSPKEDIQEAPNALQVNNISLRKRKLDTKKNNDSSVAKKTRCKKKNFDKKTEVSIKKRKLRNSPTVGDAESLELNANQNNSTQLKIDSFLEENVIRNSEMPKSEDSKKELEESEKSCSDSNRIESLDDGKSAVETLQVAVEEKSVVNAIVNTSIQTVPSEKPKKKIRRPTRGLNDCIAMLTNKLNKNLEDSANNDIFNAMSISSYYENSVNKEIEISQHILKVPLSNEHFQLNVSVKQNKEIELVSSDLKDTKKVDTEKNEYEDISENVNENVQEPVPPTICTNEEKTDEIVDQTKIVNTPSEENDISTKVTVKAATKIKHKKSKINFGKLNECNVKTSPNKVKKSKKKRKTAVASTTEPVLPPLPDGLNHTLVSKEVAVKVSIDLEEIMDKKGEQHVIKNNSDSEDEVPLASLVKDDCSNSLTSQNISERSDGENINDILKNALENCDILNDNELSENAEISKDNCFEDNNILHYECGEENQITEEIGEEISSQNTELSENCEIPIDASENGIMETTLNSDLCESNMMLCENITANTMETEAAINNQGYECPQSIDVYNFNDENVDVIRSSLLTDCNRDTLFVNNIEGATKKTNLVKRNIKTDDAAILRKDDSNQENQLFENYGKSTEECDDKFENSPVILLDNVKLKSATCKKDEITNENKDINTYMDSNGLRKHDSSNRNKERRKLIRNAKAKAREVIFDEALQELTENERNINNTDIDPSDKDSGELICPKEGLESLDKSVEITTETNSLQVINLDDNLVTSTEESFQNDSNHDVKRDVNNELDNGKELRRSKRNAKRVTSYNEIDLVDPLLDDIDGNKLITSIVQETTRKFLLEKPRQSKVSCQKKAKNDPRDIKLSGDELFDLLKAQPNENVLTKPTNSFLNNFDDLSNDFTNDNFDALEDILEKSIAVIEENLAERMVPSVIVNNEEMQKEEISAELPPILEIQTELSCNSQNQNNSNKNKPKRKVKNSKQRKHQRKLLGEEIENKLNTFAKNVESDLNVPVEFDNASKEYFSNNNGDNSNHQGNQPIQRSENDKNKVSYCEICDKFFSRVESLTKHKRTLTHISKLSELEAKEAALKAKHDQLIEETEVTSESRRNLNLLDILETIETTDCKESSPPFSVRINNSNLKLADIINDVLNKPVLKRCGDKHNFSDIIVHTPSEIKRCKSLAERKSFESENHQLKNDLPLKTVDYFEPEIANTAGTILEKQITLLENIIENRSNLSYIDELTISSSHSESENVPPINNKLFSRQENPIHTYPDPGLENNLIKSSLDEESFLKPSQYEEISEDSNLRNYDEQKSRKVLNRDEELFLECCSLLKSGSEISNYSKDLNILKTKQYNEPEWLENESLQKEHSKDIECFSDNSRITTPLGDNFSPDESNSATISSQWNVNDSSLPLKNASERDFSLENKNLTFEEVFNIDDCNEETFSSDQSEDLQPITVSSSFDGATKFDLNDDVEDRPVSPEENRSVDCGNRKNEGFCPTNTDNRKMLTKGAMKVFEGLKVSIPTEELNMAKILTYSPPIKKHLACNEYDSLQRDVIDEVSASRPERKSVMKKKKKTTTKSSQPRKQYNSSKSSKIHDVYDFEETQDNSDVFTRPDFRSFRNNYDKSRKNEKGIDSDNDSQDYIDGISIDAFSSSTSSVSELPNKIKSNSEQNITKKKCMIMGRIFKNAAKSRILDDNIRNIPIIDNTRLVEDFVLSCPEPPITNLEKPKMTEEEMNLAFDRLVNGDSNEIKQTVTESCSSNERNLNKNNFNRKKSKSKTKKRTHGHSDSSDDEFRLQKYPRKRIKKKNSSTEESCINLEQELRECIGVASRKSQRKCTSGKQNVLIEYWSSDESIFEAEVEVKNLEKVAITSDDYNDKEVPNKPTESTKFEDEKTNFEDISRFDANCEENTKYAEKPSHKKAKSLSSSSSSSTYSSSRRKRATVNPLYHWSSSSEDESRDLIEVKPLRDEIDDDDDRPVQHGWIVGDSPKKLVTMLAQAKGKKCEVDSVKEYGKKRTNTFS